MPLPSPSLSFPNSNPAQMRLAELAAAAGGARNSASLSNNNNQQGMGGMDIGFSPMFGFNPDPSPVSAQAGLGPSTTLAGSMRGSMGPPSGMSPAGFGGNALSPRGSGSIGMSGAPMAANIQNLISPNFGDQNQQLPRSMSFSHSTSPHQQQSQPQTQPNMQHRYSFQELEGMKPFDAPIWVEGMSLPRDDIVRDLIELYYQKVAPSTFIFIKRPDENWDPPWSVVVHGMVVLSLRFTRDERVLEFKEQIYTAAKRYVFLEAMEQTSVETLQALALVSLDVIGSGKGPENWGCLAMLTRSAVTTDLLRETGSDVIESSTTPYTGGGPGTAPRIPSVLSKITIIATSGSWKEDEERRRLFWLIFALDRYTCSTTAIDAAIPVQDVRRRLPCADELWRGDVRLLSSLHSETAAHALRHLYRTTSWQIRSSLR